MSEMIPTFSTYYQHSPAAKVLVPVLPCAIVHFDATKLAIRKRFLYFYNGLSNFILAVMHWYSRPRLLFGLKLRVPGHLACGSNSHYILAGTKIKSSSDNTRIALLNRLFSKNS
jgi:hypothetical protein